MNEILLTGRGPLEGRRYFLNVLKLSVAIVGLAVVFTGMWIGVGARSEQLSDERAEAMALRAEIETMTRTCIRKSTEKVTMSQ